MGLGQYTWWNNPFPEDDFDEPPQQWFQCDACDGSGEEAFAFWGYEPGCGHGHMIEDGRPCGKCNGDGGWLDDADKPRQ